MNCLKLFYLGVSLLPCAAAVHAQPDLVLDWEARSASANASDDQGRYIVTDEVGDLYVSGRTWNGNDWDIITVKYDQICGKVLWETVYDGGDDDTFPVDMKGGNNGIALGFNGKILYVVGQTSVGGDNDFITLAYDTDKGEILWDRRYDGPAHRDDEAYAVTTFGDFVYVVGESRNSSDFDDVVLAKYKASTGQRLCTARYDGNAGLHDFATSIDHDEAGNVYICGASQRLLTGLDWFVASYDPSCARRWVAPLKDGPGAIEIQPDFAWDLAVCGDVVYVTGQLNGVLTGVDMCTCAYRISDGHEIDCAVEQSDGDDAAYAIAVNEACDVFVTGVDELATGRCMCTICYDGLMLKQWEHPYGDNGVGRDVATDADDSAYVVGEEDGDYVVIKFTPAGFPVVRVWDDLDSGAWAVAVNTYRHVFVTGESQGAFSNETDIATLKYVPAILTVPVVVPTIQSAVDAASDFDVIHLMDGVYTGAGNHSVDFGGKSIMMRSTGCDPEECIIDCQGLDRGFTFPPGPGPPPALAGVAIENGAAVDGGAIASMNTSPLIRWSVLRGNVASGGMFPVWQNCLDQALGGLGGRGGAMYCSGGAPALLGCQITGNLATSEGGGIYTVMSDFDLRRCTITDNRAMDRGGGICQASGSGSLWRTILWGNCADTAVGDEWYCNNGSRVFCCSDVNMSGLEGFCMISSCPNNEPNIDADPLFCLAAGCEEAPTTAGDYRLRVDSPCAPDEQPECGLLGAQGIGCESICPDDPDGFLRMFGGTVTGNALDLCTSDDVRLDVLQSAQLSPLLPYIRLEYWGHSVFADNVITSLEYTVECHVSAIVPGGQHPGTLRTHIRDYASGFFEMIDQRGTDPFTDEVINHLQTTNASNYLQAGDGEVRVRQDVWHPGNVLSANWFLKVDLYEVTITQ